MAEQTIPQLMAAAIAATNAGRRAEARRWFEQVLKQKPAHAEALHRLGFIAMQDKRLKEALDLMDRSIAIDPKNALYHSNRGSVLLELNLVDEAVAAFERSVELQPKQAMLYSNLGQGLRRSGKMEKAIAAFSRAVELQADYAKAHSNLAQIYAAMGRLDEAIASQRTLAGLRSNDAYTHLVLGQLLQRAQRSDNDIAAAYQRALSLGSNDVAVLRQLAGVLRQSGASRGAAAAEAQIAKLQPTPENFFNMGCGYTEVGDLDTVIAAYRQAVALRPTYTEAWTNLGAALKDSGRLDQALACYEKALSVKPDNIIAHSNIIYVMEFHAGSTPKGISQEQHRYHQMHAQLLRNTFGPPANDRSPNRRLKVGYVSPDFREHVVGSNLLPLMENHDHQRFEIFCYSSVAKPDALTARFRALADQWRDIATIDDALAATLIREDEIDILVDLSVHMAGNRQLIFARKPAPIQVTYLGYCGSTGLEAMDYRFSDPQMDPPEADPSLYSERTIRLSECYWCYRPPVGDPPAVSPLPAQERGHLSFGCLNNFGKVTLPTQQLWAEVLKQVPGSRLLIHALEGSHRRELKDRFEAWGVAPERIHFVFRQQVVDYLRTYNRVDIALDPFPYAGGITSCDALWMGCPVVTMSGQTPVSRGGRTILHNLGLDQWVATTPEQYVRIAVGLASDVPRLASLRPTLRGRMLRSPLMDAPRLARVIEDEYRQMWGRWILT